MTKETNAMIILPIITPFQFIQANTHLDSYWVPFYNNTVFYVPMNF